MNADVCKYDPTENADRNCYNCGAGLCDAGSCGYKVDAPWVEHMPIDLCNECYAEFEEESAGRCSECGTELQPIYEDTHPDGVGYYEIVGYKACYECKNDN